ncbi:hypothetical protein [Massilia sp. Leaf139]|uniref:hypothetical protein n=1 Tax=Massilia sp. Leaf139 TaxID=1736272 RepID=UPI00138F5C81|nr:hypothetical protein [Massilia sp. Leaf139]
MKSNISSGLRVWKKLVAIQYGVVVRSTGGHREHIVPRIIIRNGCLAMLNAGASINDLRDAIIVHLGIVEITRQEAYYLDYELNLKIRFPWVGVLELTIHLRVSEPLRSGYWTITSVRSFGSWAKSIRAKKNAAAMK